MIADGLTKALPGQRFKAFMEMIGMVDIQGKLQNEKRLEDLQERLLATKD
jgi:hypothetical protein